MILLTNETVDILLKSNGIFSEIDENYNTKILKLQNAGLLNKNEEFYNNEMKLILNVRSGKDVIDERNLQIQNFFVDGSYRRLGVGYSNSVYPNGPVYDGNYTLFSNYEFNDKTKPFLQKNIFGQTVANNETRISIFTFNILNNATVSSSLGTAISGTYYIDGDRLYANFDEGYYATIGEIAKSQYIYQKTPGGYIFTHYVWNKNEKKYEIVHVNHLIRLLL
jgi:hypothetical protein